MFTWILFAFTTELPIYLTIAPRFFCSYLLFTKKKKKKKKKKKIVCWDFNFNFINIRLPQHIQPNCSDIPFISIAVQFLLLCENKGADQLRSNCEVDQHLCFRYTDSTIPLLLIRNFNILACLFDCTCQFVLHLIGNPEDRFSRVAAHMAVDVTKLVAQT